jgi:hypothetical protein
MVSLFWVALGVSHHEDCPGKLKTKVTPGVSGVTSQHSEVRWD